VNLGVATTALAALVVRVDAPPDDDPGADDAAEGAAEGASTGATGAATTVTDTEAGSVIAEPCPCAPPARVAARVGRDELASGPAIDGAASLLEGAFRT